jgi:TIR domain
VLKDVSVPAFRVERSDTLGAMSDAGGGADRTRAGEACDVFISYAHGDRPKAAALARALEHRGLQVWWDPDLRAGDPWARKIEQAVEEALSVVVLWSAQAVESQWVSAEARVGLDEKKLVPVRLDEAEPPLVFREIQWRSFAGWDGEGEPPGIGELVADIDAVIARSSGGAGRGHHKPPPGAWPWSAVAALVAGLVLGTAAVGLGLWGATLEGATDVVLRSGFPLPPLAMQVAALGLAVLYLARHRRRVWPLRAASPVRVLTCALALALGLGVLYDWAQALGSRRDHIIGRIVATERHGMRARALDSLGLEMSERGAAVDDEEGTFVLRFKPVFGDRPRALVVQQPGCAPEALPIGRREWRSGRDLDKTFACRRAP